MPPTPSWLTIITTSNLAPPLPGAATLPLLGQPLFLRTVARARQATQVGPVVVATSTEPADDPIAHACWDAHVPYFRGHPTDLVDRIYRAGLYYNAGVLLLLDATAPLIDPAIIDEVACAYVRRHGEVDYVSNRVAHEAPSGHDAEMITMDGLATIWRHAWGVGRQAIAPLLQKLPHPFRAHLVTSAAHAAGWPVVSRDSYHLVQAVYHYLYPRDPHFDDRAVRTFLQARPDVASLAPAPTWHQDQPLVPAHTLLA